MKCIFELVTLLLLSHTAFGDGQKIWPEEPGVWNLVSVQCAGTSGMVKPLEQSILAFDKVSYSLSSADCQDWCNEFRIRQSSFEGLFYNNSAWSGGVRKDAETGYVLYGDTGQSVTNCVPTSKCPYTSPKKLLSWNERQVTLSGSSSSCDSNGPFPYDSSILIYERVQLVKGHRRSAVLYLRQTK